jgi:hypothetical protein
MKRTLLILAALISLNCLGQDTIGNLVVYDDSIGVLESGYYNIVFGNIPVVDTYAVKPPTEEELIISAIEQIYPLRFLWSKYSEECYNDSTEVEYLVTKDNYGRNKYILPTTISTLDTINFTVTTIKLPLFDHKQPTPKGFMDWMNGKYNK